MRNLIPLLFVLQGYCIYHAYKNQKGYLWLMVILFIPILGALTYIFSNFGKSVNLEEVGESIKEAMDSDYDVEKLLKESKYSDTIANRIKLADSYASRRQYGQAIALYESCLQGFNADDLMTKEKLMVAKYFSDDYEGVKVLGDSLNEQYAFRNSESRIVYAWSLHYLGLTEQADTVFKEMDVRFSNYVHRSEYAKFLIEENRIHEARELLIGLQDEISHMESGEQRQKRDIRKEITNILKSIR